MKAVMKGGKKWNEWLRMWEEKQKVQQLSWLAIRGNYVLL